jgi:hypothetical protein
LSSPADGNTWFLGQLKDPQPKPVWGALAAAFSPLSVSLEVWDRNYVPGQTVKLPLYFFNDLGESRLLTATVRVVAGGAGGEVMSSETVTGTVPAHGQRKTEVALSLPQRKGDWRFEAELTTPVAGVTHPIVSSWRIRTLEVAVPSALVRAAVAVSPDETEIRAFLRQNGLTVTGLEDPAARVRVGSKATWEKIRSSPGMRRQWGEAVDRGQSLVLLDIGPRELGQGYKPGDLGPLEGAPQVASQRIEQLDLFAGVHLAFHLVAEPESHLQPALRDDSLWSDLPRQSTWLWNGLRGGLVVPAEDMEVTGLSSSAFVSLWAGRGADRLEMQSGRSYYAYQLAGFYVFSSQEKDAAAIAQLRSKVKALTEDAPSLENLIDPKAPIEPVDLTQAYRRNQNGKAEQLTPLASCGKSLTRLPIVELSFGPGQGRVLLSQVLTAGRLVRGAAEPGLYGIRYDPAAEQFTLNLIAHALAKPGP